MKIRTGLIRLERMTFNRMSESQPDSSTPASLINPRTFMGILRECFGASQSSQFMDQILVLRIQVTLFLDVLQHLFH